MTATGSSSNASLERAGFWLTTASLGVTQFNLLAAQTFFGLAAICWLVLTLRRDDRGARIPAWFLPLTIYAALTIVSALFSLNRAESLTDCKQLVLFLMVPIVMRFARGERAGTVLTVIVALGLADAVYGFYDYLFVQHAEWYRPTGLLAQHMTYAGLLMLIACAATASVLFTARRRVLMGVAAMTVLAALAVTKTRNAWVGVLAGLGAVFVVRRIWLIVLVPLLVGAFVLLAPTTVRQRAATIFDPTYTTNADRLILLQMARDIVHDHPLLGVGPDQVKVAQLEYRKPYPSLSDPLIPHMHDVPAQIAAERGLPALAVWLWFIAVVLVQLFRQVKRGPARDVAAAGLAATIAMLVAGLFEYNFGDSEFLMLYLGLITLPFAAACGLQSAPDGPASRDPRAAGPVPGAGV